MRLIQYVTRNGTTAVGRISADGVSVQRVAAAPTMRELALTALQRGVTLATLADREVAESEGYDAVIAERRLLSPMTHDDPAHCVVTGTGLTHLGSASARDSMHQKIQGDESSLTDSMKMFKWGLQGGKPAAGQQGVAPEWFYKGDGSWLVPPEGEFAMPDFALDGGDEAEVVGLYVIGPDRRPYRLGFALGNEFSDHVLERQNYLYLAHSKLRQSACGPELVTGPLPATVQGMSRIRRNGEVIWEKPFLSGEDNMSHTIANLEHHHFKYAQFLRPGDVHVHYYGAAVLSCSDGVKTEPGDRFEIEAEGFGRPLRNTLRRAAPVGSMAAATL